MTAPTAVPETRAGERNVVARAAAALLAVALAGWLITVIVSWPTYHQLPPASGAVAALADAVLRGQAPGAEDGQSFLGTYYLPPTPLVVAALRRLGLAWKDAQRTTSMLFACFALATIAVLARRLGASAAGIGLALGLAIAAYPFKIASLMGRADLLAVGCSFAALAAWCRDPDLKGWRVSALGAAALLVKAIAVSVPVAVTIACATRRDPGAWLRFAWRFVAAFAIGVALLSPWHGPAWVLQIARDMFGATPGTWNVWRGPAELLRYFGTCPEITIAVAVAALLLLGSTWRGQPPAFFGVASVALAWFVFSDFGAGENHLLELSGLAAACAGAWVSRALSGWAALPPPEKAPGLGAALARGVRAAVARKLDAALQRASGADEAAAYRSQAVAAASVVLLAIGLGIAGATWRDLLPIVRHVPTAPYRRAELIAAVRAEPGPVLTEDAGLALAAGRRPAICDPGALRALSLRGDPRAVRVVDSLRAGRFALVVLMNDLEASESWYRRFHLGDPAVDALSGYRKAGVIEGWNLYRPVR